MSRTWKSLLSRFLKANARPVQPIRRAPHNLRIEPLEDRVVPAISILDQAAGGTLDADLLADGIVNADGTISRGALTGVSGATNISVTAATGGIAFADFAAAVTLLTGGGSAASFIAPAGAITFADPADSFSTSGGGLVFTAGGAGNGLTLAALTGSSLVATAPGNIGIGSATSTGAVTITSTAGSVTSTGPLQSAAQLTLNAATGITASTSAVTLQASNSTSGNIAVTQTALPAQLLTITNAAGGVVNNAPGGTITVTNLGNAVALGASALVRSNGGDITLAGQDLIIDPSSSVNANNGGGAGGGAVTLRNSDAGRAINLGGNGVVAGQLVLTQAELARVTGASLVRVGSATSGAFDVTAPVAALAAFNNTLTLTGGAAMTDTGTGGVTAANLKLSGAGPVTLDNGAGNNVTNLVASLTGALTYSNGTNLLTVGAGIDGTTGVTTTNADVTLIADDIDVTNAVNAGTGIVNFRAFTGTRDYFVGGTGAGLSVTDAELGRVTAGKLRIGDPTFTGTGQIAVNAAVTRHAGYNTLSLLTGNSSATAITQTAPLSVARLALMTDGGDVTFTNAGNDVDALSGDVTSTGGATPAVFSYADTGGAGFVVDTVDFVQGLYGQGVRADAVAGSRVTLSTVGLATQAAGSDVRADQLQLLGSGSYALNNVGNDVATVAAATTGGVSYTDANGLTIGTVNATPGIGTSNAAIAINTVDGPLTVTDTARPFDVDAGNAAVTLTAGDPNGTDPDLTINAGAAVRGNAGVTLVGDNIVIDTSGTPATVTAGAGTATLRPFANGTVIDLGGADTANTLGLTPAELDRVTAGVIVVGSATAGDIGVSAPIAPTGTSQLELVTGGAAVDNNTTNPDITVARLGITAGTGVGVAGAESAPLDISVNNVEATTGTVGVFLNNNKALTVGGVNGTLQGVTAAAGPIQITAADGGGVTANLTVTEAVSATGGGNIQLTIVDPNSATTLLVSAPVAATGGNGSVALQAGHDLTVNAPVSAVGSGTVTATANFDGIGGGDFASTAAVGTAAGAVSVSGNNVTIGGPVSATGGGAITATATAGHLTNTAAVTASGGNGNVLLQSVGNVNVQGAVRAAGAGTLTVTADSDNALGGDFTSTAAGTLDTAGGGITVSATNATVGGDITTAAANIFVTALLHSGTTFTNQADVAAGGGSSVTVRFDAYDLQAGSTIGTTGAGEVNLRVNTGGVGMDLGSAAAGANFTQAELDTVTAAQLRLTAAADIAFSQNIVLAVAKVPTLVLEAAGGVVDGTAAETTLLTVQSLALKTGTGIGDADDLNVAVSNLAFRNATSGNVDISNTGALTIASVFDVTTSSNAGAGSTSVSAASPLTFAVNTTSVGPATYTAGETSDFPACADDLTVNAGVTVSVTGPGNALILRAGDDVVIDGTASAAGALQLIAGFNDLDGCGTVVINGTISGNPITISAPNDICVTTLNVGASALILISTGGAILDCDPVGADDLDITAGSLSLRAATGIGTAAGTGGVLETAVPRLEAQTATGGIFLANTGPLNIGGVDPAVDGVQVATSGDISLTSTGSIVVDGTSAEDIHTTSGDVLVSATGPTADVLTGNDTIAYAIASGAGNVTIMAGRDVLLGDPGTGRYGDVGANGNLLITAGRDVVVDEDTFVEANGTGTLTVTAGRDVSVLATGASGSHLTTSGGTITITTGAGGVLTVTSGSTSAIDSTNAGADGAITINADDVVIDAVSNVNSGTGTTTIRQVTGTRAVDLGTDTPGTLGLTDAELDQINAALLRIGAAANAGNITFTAAVTLAAGSVPTLSLLTAGNVTDTGAGSVGVTNLAVAASLVTLDAAGNDVTTLAGTATGAFTTAFTYYDATGLTVGGPVDGQTGVTATNGGVDLQTAAGGMTVAQDVSAAGAVNVRVVGGTFANQADVTAGTGFGILIRTDAIDLQAGSTIQSDREVNIAAASAGVGLNLGSPAAGLDFTQAELDTITATQLRLTATADVTLVSAVTLSARVPTLYLEAGFGGVVDGSAGEQPDLTVANLAVQAANGIGSADDLDVSTTNLAAQNTAAGNVSVFNTGALTIARNVGLAPSVLSGVTNAAPGGNVSVGTGSPLVVDAIVSDTGGGNIDLFTTGAGGDLTVTANGQVLASGGNGNITLSTAAATSGGAIDVNDNPAGDEVSAAGTGAITLDARTAATLRTGVVVVSGTAGAGGNVTVRSNVGVANGTANVVLEDGVTVLTTETITLDADPDGNCTGGNVVFNPATTTLAGPGGTNAGAIVIRTGVFDITLTTLLADDLISVTTCGNILNDGDDATFISANRISLTSGGRIGGTNIISPADVLSADPAVAPPTTTRFLAAVDFALTGPAGTRQVTITQTAAGNVQLRQVNGALRTSVFNLTNAVVGTVNQLALIAAGGTFTVDGPLNPPSNQDTLLATTGGNSIVFAGIGAAVNNAATPGASTTLVASGSTLAGITGPADNVPEVSGSNLVLVTTGGPIGAGAGSPFEFNALRLDGFTNGNGAAGGNAALRDTDNGLSVGQFVAGGGDVYLASRGNVGTTNLLAVTPNDGVPEVVGNFVFLDTSAAPQIPPAPGQIGQPGVFFEVNANVLSAATNNSSLWVSEVGTGATLGALVRDVSAGTGTAFLRVRNGGLITSETVDGSADVTAATVNLSTVAGDPAGGGFGASAGSPLEINATTLNANLAGTSGNLFVADTAGGLTVQRATTTGGNVGLTATGADLIIGNGSSTVTVVQAPGGTATLTAGAAIASAAPGAVRDVLANSLALSAGAGVGSTATPLETTVGTLAGTAAGGDFVLANAGPLTIDVVGTQTGVTAPVGYIYVHTGTALTVLKDVISTGGSTTVASDTAGVTVTGATVSSSAGTFLNSATTTDLTGGAIVTATNLSSTFVNVGTALAVTDSTIDSTDGTQVTAGTTVAVTGNSTVGSGDFLNLTAGTNLTIGVGATVTATTNTTVFVGANNAGSDNVVRGTLSAAGIPQIIGAGGNDVVLIDFTGGASLPNGANFDAAGGTADELQVSDALGGAAHAYVIGGTDVTRDGTTDITVGNVESIDATGGNLADTFTVVPSPTVAVDVHGGTPTVAPGDTLTVLNAATAFLSTTPSGGSVSGTYDFPAGTQDVTFAEIETLNTGADAVAITKDDGITAAVPGTTVTYTVVVTNTATVGLTGISVADVVPAAITGVSWSAAFAGVGSTGTANGTGSINQTIALAAGGTATYTITGTLNPTTPAGTGTLVNTATVTPPAGVTDTAGNDTATDTDDVVPTGNVVVTKTDGVTTVFPGNSTTYTIVVSNAGPSTVTLTLADVFPAAVTTATRTATNAGGATGGTNGTGNINESLTIPAGGSVTYSVVAAVSPTAPAGAMTNTATATVTTPGWVESTPGDESATDTDTLVPTGDVSVTKTDGVTTVIVGGTTTYTVVVRNTGPSTATATVADVFPAGITTATRTVAATGGATGGTAGTGSIADTLTLPAGGTVTYTVVAQIDPAAAPGTLANTATATVTTAGWSDTTPGNETATDTDTLVAAPDLVAAAAAPGTAVVGTPFTYTFTVTNNGVTTASNVVLTHDLPADAINVTATTSAGTAAVANGVLTVNVGTMTGGQVVTVTVTLNPTHKGVFNLSATATTTTVEPNVANNTAAALTQVAPYQPLIVVGPGNGGGAQVRVLNADTGALVRSFVPFGDLYTGAINVAKGDINGDGVPELIIGAGPGGAPRVSVFDVRTGAVLMNFFAYTDTVRAGVNIAAGDIDGDGKDDVITGAGGAPGFGPHVKVFSGATGAEIRSFFAYAPTFNGGVRVAAGDTNGDGQIDIITGAGGGGSAHVKVFDGAKLTELQSFFAYDAGLRDGVFVAAGDTNGDGIDEIITGAGGGGSAHVKEFDGTTLAVRKSFYAFAPSARDGVTVATTDRNSDGLADIAAGTAVGVQAQVKFFNATTGQEDAVFNAFDLGFVGGVFVG